MTTLTNINKINNFITIDTNITKLSKGQHQQYKQQTVPHFILTSLKGTQLHAQTSATSPASPKIHPHEHHKHHAHHTHHQQTRPTSLTSPTSPTLTHYRAG
jgi:hypothetical protein